MTGAGSARTLRGASRNLWINDLFERRAVAGARDSLAFASGSMVWRPLLSRETDLTGKVIGLDLTVESAAARPRRVEVRFPLRSREGA